MTYLHHITLTTGHTRRSYRSECDDGLIAQLRPIVSECERNSAADLPTPTGIMILRRIVETDNPSRHVAIWAISEPQGPALYTIALAMTARAGAGLWRTLHALHSEPTALCSDPTTPPSAPWLAAIPHMTAMMPPHPSLHWIGDAERCIAWAWIAECHAQT